MRQLPMSLVLVTLAVARPTRAQLQPSLGVGVGTVRFPGGSSFSSASLSPALQYAAPTLVTGVSGSFASLPDAVWSSQGRGYLWVASPPMADRWRIGVEATLAGTKRGDGGWTTAAQGLGELIWSRPRWGFGAGAGPSAGWMPDQPAATAFRARARAWWRPDAGAWRTDWSASVEPTRLRGAWFTDVTVGATLERRPVLASFWTAARVSDVHGSAGAASAFLQFFVLPNAALEVGGGSYLSDPYQDLPRAGFVTLGVRLHGRPRAPALPRGGARGSPLVPEARGDSLVVRFQFDGALSVAIAGDWNQWQPMPLRALGGNGWEAVLALPRGIHHFNILVNGTEWLVPTGVATVSDGLGGMVGVLVVP